MRLEPSSKQFQNEFQEVPGIRECLRGGACTVRMFGARVFNVGPRLPKSESAFPLWPGRIARSESTRWCFRRHTNPKDVDTCAFELHTV